MTAHEPTLADDAGDDVFLDALLGLACWNGRLATILDREPVVPQADRLMDPAADLLVALAFDLPADVPVDLPVAVAVAVDLPTDLDVDRLVDVAVDLHIDLAADLDVDLPIDVGVDLPVCLPLDRAADLAARPARDDAPGDDLLDAVLGLMSLRTTIGLVLAALSDGDDGDGAEPAADPPASVWSRELLR